MSSELVGSTAIGAALAGAAPTGLQRIRRELAEPRNRMDGLAVRPAELHAHTG